MLRKFVIGLTVGALLLLGGQTFAEFCTIDAVPAATLLLPKFIVESCDDPAGVTTLFSINNASAAPALAHVTLWTDFSIPTLDFDVYLTGYDVQTINLRDVICDGVLPQTGSGALISNREPGSEPEGLFSLNNTNFTNCNGTNTVGSPPVYPIPALSNAFRALVQASLSGLPRPSDNRCAAVLHADGSSTGYITVDSVSQCNQLFPDDPGYFGAGGVANQNNLLWGDYFQVSPGGQFAFGDNLVHIQADVTDTQQIQVDGIPPDGTTFYSRYLAGAFTDYREPLGSVGGIRYNVGGAFDGGTELQVFRVPPIAGATLPSVSGVCLLDQGFTQRQVIVFDEEENPFVIVEGPSGFEEQEENPFPNEVNDVFVGDDLTIDEPFGWIYLNLNGCLADYSTATFGTIITDPNYFCQAWVTASLTAEDGQFNVGLPWVQFNSGCDPNSPVLGEPIGGNPTGVITPNPPFIPDGI